MDIIEEENFWPQMYANWKAKGWQHQQPFLFLQSAKLFKQPPNADTFWSIMERHQTKTITISQLEHEDSEVLTLPFYDNS